MSTEARGKGSSGGHPPRPVRPRVNSERSSESGRQGRSTDSAADHFHWTVSRGPFPQSDHSETPLFLTSKPSQIGPSSAADFVPGSNTQTQGGDFVSDSLSNRHSNYPHFSNPPPNYGHSSSSNPAPRISGPQGQQNENLIRRLVAERDAVLFEYSTVMSERDKVHEEMDRLANELTSKKSKVEELEAIIQQKSTETLKLDMDLAAVKNLFWGLTDLLIEMRSDLSSQFASVANENDENLRMALSILQALLSNRFDNFFSEAAMLNSRRLLLNQRQSRVLSVEPNSERRLLRRRRSSSSQDEHERSVIDLLHDTDPRLSSLNNGPSVSNTPLSNVTGFSLFVERIRCLQNELKLKSNKLENATNEKERLKQLLLSCRSENSSLMLQVERQRSDKKNLQQDLAMWPKIVSHRTRKPTGEIRLVVKVSFFEAAEFSWSNFGVLFSDVVGNIAVWDVVSESPFSEILKPKFKLMTINRQHVKSLSEMRSKLHGYNLKEVDFEFLVPEIKQGLDKCSQTESAVEMWDLSFGRAYSIIEPDVVPNIPRSPFTRNSQLRSPLVKNSNDTLNRYRVAGMSRVERKRHRSYSPSMDISLFGSPSRPSSSQFMGMVPRNASTTLPRQKTDPDWLLQRRSDTFGRHTNEELIESRESEDNSIDEANSDDLFDNALFEFEDETNTAELHTIEDMDSNFSSGLDNSPLDSPKSAQLAGQRQGLTVDRDHIEAVKNFPVSHKQVVSEPCQTHENKSTQVDPYLNPALEEDRIREEAKSSVKKDAPEMTWPRMRQTVLQTMKSSEHAKPKELIGNDSKGSPRSIRLPFRKRSTILGFKFSPVASLKSKSSSKSNSLKGKGPPCYVGENFDEQSHKLSKNAESVNKLPRVTKSFPRVGGADNESVVTEDRDHKKPKPRAFSVNCEAGGNIIDEHSDAFDWLDLDEVSFSGARRDHRDPILKSVHMTKEREENLGISVVERRKGEIVVERVQGHSVAEGAGVTVGDSIVEFNGVNFRGASYVQAKAVLSSSDTDVTMLLSRSTEAFTQSQRRSGPEDDFNCAKRSQRNVFITRDNTSQGFGFWFCGGNLTGIFVSKVTSSVVGSLQLGDRILQVNGIPVDDASFEEFYLLLKTIPFLQLNLVVESNVEDFKKLEAAQSFQRDKFFVRVLDLGDNVSESTKGANNSEYLPMSAGDVLCVKDSMFRGTLGVWYATKVDQRELELQEHSGKVVSSYTGLLSTLSQLPWADRRSVPLEMISENEKQGSLGSFRKFLLKRITSGSSFTLSTTGLSKQGSLDSSHPNLWPSSVPSYEFERVQRFDLGFQRPVFFIGAFCDLLLNFFASNYSKRFQIFDLQMSEPENSNVTDKSDQKWLLEASYSLRSSMTKAQISLLKSASANLPKGVHPILCGDLLKLKRLIDNDVHPLVFALEPCGNPKSLRDIYYLLSNGQNLNSRKTRKLLYKCENLSRELKKMKFCWCKLTGTLNDVELKVIKHTEPKSNFNLFTVCEPNSLSIHLSRQIPLTQS